MIFYFLKKQFVLQELQNNSHYCLDGGHQDVEQGIN